ncbi:hypothetical protein ACFL59_15295, partial [Planctomycetota bacterium]
SRWKFTAGTLWPKAAAAALVCLLAAPFYPIMVPILPPQKLVDYMGFLGVEPPKTEVGHVGPLMQLFGDQFGWEELVDDVAEVFHSLPPEERAATAICASNYGEAGALNLYGPSRGLPPPICAHQNHHYWGYRDFDGDTVIWLQRDRKSLAKLFRSVEKGKDHFHPWAMGEENRTIHICRGFKTSLPELWPQLKSWN